MTPPQDPYRTLGLARGATLDDVKRAYRALAKVNHPDVAGAAALPRFLAIRAAYEQLVSSPGLKASSARAAARARASAPPAGSPKGPGGGTSSRDGAEGRADASQRAYGGRSRRTAGAPPGPGTASGGDAGTGPTKGRRTRRPASGAGAGAGPAGAASGSAGQAASGDPTADRDAPPGKATLGSTSYDGADALPFEPDWGGASWYGTTSGTYWTINPKEYADPRKHGPEYQARARRTARARADAAASVAGAGTDAAAGSPSADATAPRPGDGGSSGAAAGAGAAPGASAGPTHTTSSWWDSTAGAEEPGTEPPPSRPSRPASRDAWGTGAGARASTSTTAPPPPDLAAAAADLGRALTDERTARGRWRFVQAFIGWLPVVFGLGWVIGELTGCGRFSASCDGLEPFLAPVIGIVVLGVLLLIPLLAALSATATVALVVAAVPTALVLSAGGEAVDSASRSSALGVVVVVAWLVGLAIAVARRIRASPSTVGRAGPVS